MLLQNKMDAIVNWGVSSPPQGNWEAMRLFQGKKQKVERLLTVSQSKVFLQIRNLLFSFKLVYLLLSNSLQWAEIPWISLKAKLSCIHSQTLEFRTGYENIRYGIQQLYFYYGIATWFSSIFTFRKDSEKYEDQFDTDQ